MNAGLPTPNEVMRRIREEVGARPAQPRRRRRLVERVPTNGSASPQPKHPELFVTPQKPGAKERFEQMLGAAQKCTTVGGMVPKFLRGFFRKQGGFNKQILDLMKLLMRENRELQKRIGEITAYLQAQNNWTQGAEQTRIAGLNLQRRQLAALEGEFEHSLDRLAELEGQMTRTNPHVEALREEQQQALRVIEAIQQQLVAEAKAREATEEVVRTGLRDEAKAREVLEQRTTADHQRLDHFGDTVAAVRAGLRDEAKARELLEQRKTADHQRLDHFGDTVEAVRMGLRDEAKARELLEQRTTANHQRLDLFSNTLETMRSVYTSANEVRELLVQRLSRSEDELKALQAEMAQMSRAAEMLARLQATVERMDERHLSDATHLRRELHLHQKKLLALTAGQPTEVAENAAEEAAVSLPAQEFDAFYVAFEDEFRGSRAVIKERVGVYLPYLRKTQAGTAAAPLLDLGCGRGEWLELLREEQLVARGVDLNAFMVEDCTVRGLDVVQADVLSYLAPLPAESVGAVTAFHLIEHLPFSAFLRLFTEALRVLQPGGICIFETPNPENVQVGSNRFYSDPTHIRPLPKDYTRFVMQKAGYQHVEVLPLHPDAGALPLPADARPVEHFVNHAFFGAQDYAVIGWK